jgi:opacity protein-like surface antigen
MRLTCLTFAAAAAVLASPAAARSGPYVGVEGGILFPQDTRFQVNAVRVQTVPTGQGLLGQTVTTTNNNFGSGFVSDYKRGVDVDVLLGYDFGFFRLEGELGHKQSRIRNFTASNTLLASINTAPITGITSSSFDFGNRLQVMSAMANGLVDLDVTPGFRIYGGGGVGRARVKTFGQRDHAWAGQLIGGASIALSENVDFGLKYRYFQTRRLQFSNTAAFSNTATGATSNSTFTQSAKFRSHSVLASLIFNFGATEAAPPPVVEAPPPPPPPPPVLTQTCPDGSVVEASGTCPVAPEPAPPPPLPSPERG